MRIVQQSIKDIHSKASCDYNHWNKFTPYYTESTLDRLTAPPRRSSTALSRLYTEGIGTKNPSHAAHHVPQTPTTTPDEDFTSYITDTLLEREQTPGHIAR